MFGRDPQAPPPGEDQTNEVPIIPPPPPNKFIVRREGRPDVEVLAHEVEMANNILRFRFYVLDPTYGPSNRVRCFNGWLDYEEVEVPVPQKPLVELVTLGGLQ